MELRPFAIVLDDLSGTGMRAEWAECLLTQKNDPKSPRARCLRLAPAQEEAKGELQELRLPLNLKP